MADENKGDDGQAYCLVLLVYLGTLAGLIACPISLIGWWQDEGSNMNLPPGIEGAIGINSIIGFLIIIFWCTMCCYENNTMMAVWGICLGVCCLLSPISLIICWTTEEEAYSNLPTRPKACMLCFFLLEILFCLLNLCLFNTFQQQYRKKNGEKSNNSTLGA